MSYRNAKKAKSEEAAAQHLKVLKENMPYFGYGYIKSTDQLVPYIPVCFWAFRVMVGLGSLFILFFLIVLHFVYRKKNLADYKWLLIGSIVLVPLAYIASESGWLVAEFGRQPWTIQDMLPTWAAVSDINSGSVALTFFIFLALFTTMLVVEISILLKQIKKGPERLKVEE
jgi:cytochrome d ubiquinol oxidase subunit I